MQSNGLMCVMQLLNIPIDISLKVIIHYDCVDCIFGIVSHSTEHWLISVAVDFLIRYHIPNNRGCCQWLNGQQVGTISQCWWIYSVFADLIDAIPEILNVKIYSFIYRVVSMWIISLYSTSAINIVLCVCVCIVF